MEWNFIKITVDLDTILNTIRDWRNNSRQRRELENVQPDLDLFTPAFELVIVIHSLVDSLNDIINRFLDFNANWNDQQKEEVSEKIRNFYSSRTRIDSIQSSIGRLEGSQQNADRTEIIVNLIMNGQNVLQAFNAKEIRTPWNFKILSQFLSDMREANTQDKAREIRRRSEEEINILRNHSFPEIDRPLGRLEQIILDDNRGNQVLRNHFNELLERFTHSPQ
jgi:hypothetical protein